MKTLLKLFFLLFFVVLNPLDAKSFSTKEMVSLVAPIEHLAIQYGEGDIKAYVFIDPKCPRSRDFISMIHENNKMRNIYRYYLFFYELKRFKSHALIQTIYSSPSPLQKTLEVMVAGRDSDVISKPSSGVDVTIGAIEHVAQELKIKKRPYLIIAKEWD